MLMFCCGQHEKLIACVLLNVPQPALVNKLNMTMTTDHAAQDDMSQTCARTLALRFTILCC
jgi:hypothetical protein